jgi:hypothetical protein
VIQAFLELIFIAKDGFCSVLLIFLEAESNGLSFIISGQYHVHGTLAVGENVFLFA